MRSVIENCKRKYKIIEGNDYQMWIHTGEDNKDALLNRCSHATM